MFNFLKQIFTWWHKQTLGTFIYTLFTGKLVGIDEFGNKYYSNSKGKRWVIYESNVESSKIPPEWHSWIHIMNNKLPNKDVKKYSWQKKFQVEYCVKSGDFLAYLSLINRDGMKLKRMKIVK